MKVIHKKLNKHNILILQSLKSFTQDLLTSIVIVSFCLLLIGKIDLSDCESSEKFKRKIFIGSPLEGV